MKQNVNRKLLSRFEKDKVSPTEFYAVKKIEKEEKDKAIFDEMNGRKKPRTAVWRDDFDKPKPQKTLAEYFNELEKKDE